MTSLLTNISAMTALTTLKGINSQLDATSNRVSTGQRVSAASDNAAYWSIATTVRTDNASLSAVKDSLGLGSSAVDTAYNGLNSVLSDLQNMRAKLQTALQPGVDRAKVQTEIKAIQDKMRSTADSSTSSGQNWLSVDSSASNAAFQATQNVVAGFSRAPTGTVSFSMIGVDVNAIKLYDVNAASITTPATSAQVTGSMALSRASMFDAATGLADFSGNNEVAITLVIDNYWVDTVRLNKTTISSAAKDLSRVTSEEILSFINNKIAASTNPSNALSGKVLASFDGAGRLVFSTTAVGSTSTLGVTNNTVTVGYNLIDVGFGLGTGSMPGDVREGFGSNAGTTAGKGILDTVDGGTGFSIATINISALVGTSGDATLGNIITQVEKAIARATDAGTRLGANKTQIDGQKAFIDSLMKANDRTIGILVDADIEEESTKLKALQTQQQLAAQALSIANSSSQNVLTLFR